MFIKCFTIRIWRICTSTVSLSAGLFLFIGHVPGSAQANTVADRLAAQQPYPGNLSDQDERELEEIRKEIKLYGEHEARGLELLKEIPQLGEALDAAARTFPHGDIETELMKLIDLTAEQYNVTIDSVKSLPQIEAEYYVETVVENEARGRSMDFLRLFDALVRSSQIPHIHGLTMKRTPEEAMEGDRYPVGASFKLSIYSYKPAPDEHQRIFYGDLEKALAELEELRAKAKEEERKPNQFPFPGAETQRRIDSAKEELATLKRVREAADRLETERVDLSTRLETLSDLKENRRSPVYPLSHIFDALRSLSGVSLTEIRERAGADKVEYIIKGEAPLEYLKKYVEILSGMTVTRSVEILSMVSAGDTNTFELVVEFVSIRDLKQR